MGPGCDILECYHGNEYASQTHYTLPVLNGLTAYAVINYTLQTSQAMMKQPLRASQTVTNVKLQLSINSIMQNPGGPPERQCATPAGARRRRVQIRVETHIK